MIWDFFEVSVWQLLVLLLHVWNYVSSTANVKASAGPEPGWGTGELVTQKEIRCASTDCDITRRSVTSDILQPCRGWWSPMTTMVHMYIHTYLYLFFYNIYFALPNYQSDAFLVFSSDSATLWDSVSFWIKAWNLEVLPNGTPSNQNDGYAQSLWGQDCSRWNHGRESLRSIEVPTIPDKYISALRCVACRRCSGQLNHLPKLAMELWSRVPSYISGWTWWDAHGPLRNGQEFPILFQDCDYGT